MSDRTATADIVSLTGKKAARVELLDPESTLIRIADVMAITSMARATVYKQMKEDPTFPRPVKLGNGEARNAPVGFVLGEVRQWVKDRISSRDEEEPPRGGR